MLITSMPFALSVGSESIFHDGVNDAIIATNEKY